MMKSE